MDKGLGLPSRCFDQGFDILDFFLCSHALLDVTEITALHSVLVGGCMNNSILLSCGNSPGGKAPFRQVYGVEPVPLLWGDNFEVQQHCDMYHPE